MYENAALWPELAVFALEIPHERDERLDAVFRERVVNRRPHPADRAVPLQAVQAGGGRLLDEHVLEIFGGEAKRHVHQRTAVFASRAAEEAGAIDFEIGRAS